MKKKHPNILVINTGSTSTKLAVFQGEQKKIIEQIPHSTEELNKLSDFEQEVDFREKKIRNILSEKNISLVDIDIIMCRGGLIRPVSSGVYQVNQQMIYDLKNAQKKHASNLAAVIGYKLSEKKENVFIADPVVVDEMQNIARFSGHKKFTRKSIFHALNHKAVARRFAHEQRKNYEDLNLIIVHIGGGISIGAHQKGKVIDVNQALDGEGPFSPERSGTLPVGDLIKMAFSNKFTYEQMYQMIVGKGGLVSYTGTNNLKVLEKKNDKDVQNILNAMVYQIAKYIGEMAVVLKGKIDAIILTGGIAHSQQITNKIQSYVDFLAPVYVYPGEDEMQALAFNGLLLWKKKLLPKKY